MKIAHTLKNTIMITAAAALLFSGCSKTGGAGSGIPQSMAEQSAQEAIGQENAAAVISQEEADYSNSENGGHAIEVDGETAEYSSASVMKTGDAEGDEADFYGENAAVYAANGAALTLSDMNITTAGTHANAVFSYGEGTAVNIKDSAIYTTGNCSGGLMTTGGGTTNAQNLTIHTTGNSSAAIRSDRGGGTVTVKRGSYTTEGVGSPAIYSTADITVGNASLTSTASEGVVVEGKNSVSLKNVELKADNNKHNSDKSDFYQAVMIYQSMSGDAASGLSAFDAEGGSITNANGDIFFVNNTATNISLKNVAVTNNGDGVFLRAAAAGWGKEGENGGNVNFTASSQKIEGDMLVDDISVLNLYLKDDSTFSGAVNPDGASGDVYVEISDGSKWVLTGDSNITSLSCGADAIGLNGHTLTVDGKPYEEGTESSGEAIEIKVREDGRGGEGMPPEKPEGDKGTPPEKPEGDKGMPSEKPEGNEGMPPEKPEGDEGMPPEKPEGDEGMPPEKPQSDGAQDDEKGSLNDGKISEDGQDTAGTKG